MSETIYTAAAIGIAAIMTYLVRGLPYMMFGGKKGLPTIVLYLGSVLPPAIMIILVVYCLRSIELSVSPYGLPEIISVALVAILQFWRKNLFLSIFMGTACYMILIRTVFA
ncbi:MAG: branched-chain amino acid transporter AzlD [Clostridiales bacterium]|nr:branched-chain amino acid transporter AzlD [Clostridiales bacterium]